MPYSISTTLYTQDCKDGGPFITKAVNLPNGTFGFNHTMQFFEKEFGFTGLALFVFRKTSQKIRTKMNFKKCMIIWLVRVDVTI